MTEPIHDAGASRQALQARVERLPATQLAGQLLVVGFEGSQLPSTLSQALRAGERAGVILFRRNLSEGLDGLLAVQDLCAQIGGTAPTTLPALIAIDEEGGRVARLRPPALALPPMRRIARLGDEELLQRVGRVLGRQLAALGVTMDFAPVVDVDTNPDNPIIGDRAFSHRADEVVTYAAAFCRGLREAGIQNCLKHFPGHGDTLEDSHLALPKVVHPRERLDRIELLPFRELAEIADSMMTAHVVYSSIDPLRPATLSPLIAGDLLRRTLGFQGVLFSDDLEMQAIAGHASAEASALAALSAGCDVLLLCSRADAQERVHRVLVERIDGDGACRRRCVEAASRSLALRLRRPSRASTPAELTSL
ncbi:MAG TPA: beta-N-acetylhexosaminidase, partial [Polyangiaceae bacterium]|nr:beta-N-acetylhexosaminidase [Polyangiaceae bacterium]